ncbi:hypothetical protein HN51_069014 [Arachis hypogaea]|uniref:uncharacterized protein n=1 Tax=Arachis hypogaea TaxID=3818 RepID=UPI000DECE9E9|nr:uncharacterized protein LOC112749787 [Arachis hypogaea]QHO11191.1 uncharacterized protein DS421_15g496010 [Arachis hypogaea]
MEKKNVVVVAVSSVVAIFGILSAALAFGAEVTRVKASEVPMISAEYCIYLRDRSSPASGLAVGAVVALVIAQIILNAANGCWCCCCRKSPHAKRSCVLVCSILSWVTFVVAILLLVMGAIFNNVHKESGYSDNYSCVVVKPGVFAAGAILSVASIATGITYYLLLAAGKSAGIPSDNSSYPNQGAIATAQPQFK